MSQRLGIYSELELRAARDLAREIVRAVRGYRLYAGNHPTLDGILDALRKRWEQATTGGPLTFRLTDQVVFLEDEKIHTASSRSEVLPCVLYDHGVVGLVLKRGLEPDEARRFVNVLAHDPEQMEDCASLLWEADLKHVQVLLDADDLEDEEDDPETPQEFAQKIADLGEPQDPNVQSEFDEARAELSDMLARGEVGEGTDAAASLFGVDDSEMLLVRELVREDNYLGTVRHALRVTSRMAREEADEEDVQQIERTVESLVAAIANSGDLPALIEAMDRAHTMRTSGEPLEMRTGELTIQAAEDAHNLSHFLRNLDLRQSVDARQLAEALSKMRPATVDVLASWLVGTRHPEAAAQALRVFGEAAVEALVPLYASSDGGARARIAPALLEIGTPQALAALSSEFTQLPEQTRLQLVQLAEHSTEKSNRRLVVSALGDPSPRIRHAAIAGVRRPDAAEIVPLLERMLDDSAFDERGRDEVEAFFEMLARIGNDQIARILAELCLPKGFTLRFRLSPLQRLCLRALRRMRAPSARPIVEELRTNGPKSVREFLDDPLADLDS